MRAQYALLMQRIDDYRAMGRKAWSLLRPCSSFASDVFSSSTGIVLQDRHLGGLGYSDPNVLYDSIRSYKGGFK